MPLSLDIHRDPVCVLLRAMLMPLAGQGGLCFCEESVPQVTGPDPCRVPLGSWQGTGGAVGTGCHTWSLSPFLYSHCRDLLAALAPKLEKVRESLER